MPYIVIKYEQPSTCGKCQFYKEMPYICHNEKGYVPSCILGFMKGDMRDKSYRNKKYPMCGLMDRK